MANRNVVPEIIQRGGATNCAAAARSVRTVGTILAYRRAARSTSTLASGFHEVDDDHRLLPAVTGRERVRQARHLALGRQELDAEASRRSAANLRGKLDA